MKPSVGLALRDKFRAEQRALRARFDSHRAGGKHAGEKGMRTEQVLIDFLREHLPPKYGVSRGEVVDSHDRIAVQADVVIYDALHAPLFQDSEGSKVFAAESVYSVIQVKPSLTRPMLVEAVEAVRSVKALDRSAVVASHGGHERLHGPPENLPPFGAIFALESAEPETLVPNLADLHGTMPSWEWVDAICVLDKTLVYHFAQTRGEDGKWTWAPTVLTPDARLGCFGSGEDTLFFFYLFLLYQLSAKELFPPDFVRYASAIPQAPPRVYLGDRLPCPRLKRPRRPARSPSLTKPEPPGVSSLRGTQGRL